LIEISFMNTGEEQYETSVRKICFQNKFPKERFRFNIVYANSQRHANYVCF